jgi:tripartite-type tricarboxylate transporter receptor subunit TctC
MKKSFGAIAAVASGLVLLGGPVSAQEKFPSRPITMIIPAPPGGGTDSVGRALGDLVEPILGQKVVIENKPGAGGTLGVTLLTQAPADGYLVEAAYNGPLTALPHTLAVSYKLDSYIPIIQFGETGYVFCTKSDFPAKDANGLIAHLKANPGKFTYAVDGIGNTVHLGAEILFQKFDVKARPVPFNGSSEQVRAVLGGHVDIFSGSSGSVLPHIKAGTLKCPFVTTTGRNPAIPDAVSLKELGVSDYQAVLWWGLIAPKGTPADRVAILEQAFRKAMESPKYKAVLANLGGTSEGRALNDFSAAIKTEYELNGSVVKRLGIQPK